VVVMASMAVRCSSQQNFGRSASHERSRLPTLLSGAAGAYTNNHRRFYATHLEDGAAGPVP
jgi:hypothetical protein